MEGSYVIVSDCKGIVLSAFLCTLSLGQCKAGLNEVSLFQREYPEAAKRLEAYLARAKGTIRLRQQVGNAPERSAMGSFAVDDGYAKFSFVVNRPPEPETEIVIAFNKDEEFSIYRHLDSKKFTIWGVGADDADRVRYFELFGNYFTAPYAVLGKPLLEIIKLPSFHLINEQSVNIDGNKYIEIHYQVSELGCRDKVVLDPHSGWIIMSGESVPTDRSLPKRQFDVNYVSTKGETQKDIKNEFMLPSLVKITSITKGGNISSKICEFTTFLREETPDKREFSITHYGLPDIAKRERLTGQGSHSQKNIIILMFIGSFVGLALAFVLRRISQRVTRPDNKE
jgi:hypothetical protein